MESIARRFNMPVNSIASLNNQSDAEIGDVLIIPTASQVERLRLGSKKSTRKASGKATAKSGSKSQVRSAKAPKRPATRGRMASAYVSGGGLN